MVGRFHPRTFAVLAGSIGVPAILAAGIIAVDDNICRYPCAAENPIWWGVLIGLVALLIESALMRRWVMHGAAWTGLVACFLTFFGYALVTQPVSMRAGVRPEVEGRCRMI